MRTHGRGYSNPEKQSPWRLYSVERISGLSIVANLTPKVMRLSVSLLSPYPIRESKWMITLLNTETGEISVATDVERYLWRRQKRMRKAFRLMRKLYKQRKISLLLITLTLPVDMDLRVVKGRFRRWRWNYRRRLERYGIKWYGDVWVLERGVNGGWHYHVVVAISRLDIRGRKMPHWIKADGWGYITRVEFVKRDVASYLSWYLRKFPPAVPPYTRTYGVNIRRLFSLFSPSPSLTPSFTGGTGSVATRSRLYNRVKGGRVKRRCRS